jgi:SAM-dependent methyltransferase
VSERPLEPVRPVTVAKCCVCGERGEMRVADPVRESLLCPHCFATCRYRSIASGILRAVHERTGIDAPSIGELPSTSQVHLSIYDTQPGFSSPPFAGYAIPELLGRLPWIELHTSSYKPTLPWGISLGGSTTNQNLERLTYPDASFDVVITTDVIEHVRLYELAHVEIARVTRPGGVYLFTVPHGRHIDEHIIRVKVHDPDDPSRDEHLLPPEFHESAFPEDEPVLSYRAFGTGIDRELRALGFDVDYSITPQPDRGIFEAELFYCRRL